MGEKKDRILLRFNAPLINNTVHVLKSDAFKLMARTSTNKTCTVVYNGPTKLVFSENENCIYPLNTHHTSSSDLVLIPNSGCKPGNILPKTTKYFISDFCVQKHENDKEDFIQVKHYHDANYVYCPESQITIDGKTRPCPSKPFLIPSKTTFKINDLQYTAERMYVEYTAKSDPIMSFRANWDLQPTLRLEEIIKDIEESELRLKKSNEFKVDEFGNGTNLYTSSLAILSLGLFICLMILLIVITYRKLFVKKKSSNSITIQAQQVKRHSSEDGNGVEMTTMMKRDD